jgi:hypothetical protein
MAYKSTIYCVTDTPTHHYIHIHLCLKIYCAHLSVIYFYYTNLLKSIKFLLNMSYINKTHAYNIWEYAFLITGQVKMCLS